MFAVRKADHLEQSLLNALKDRGRHAAVHGWTGVGKTSLVEYVFATHGLQHLSVECGGSFEDLMLLVLGRLGERVATETVEQSNIKGEASAGIMSLLKAKVGGELGSEVRYQQFSGPLESLVVDALVAAGVGFLFIDNLEDLDDDEDSRRGLCHLIKACSARTRDKEAVAPSIVLAGPTKVIEAVLGTDNAAARRTMELPVPRMTRDEIDQILVRGEALLDIVFDRDCRDAIVDYADGFPYYAQLFALETARVGELRGSSTLTSADFDQALPSIIRSCLTTLKDAYKQAIRSTTSKPSPRRGVLAALARAEDIEVSSRQVQEAFLRDYPQYERIERVRFVGRSLAELRDEHNILEEAWLDDGTRGYRFRDPLMRVYVRLRDEHDRQRAAADFRASLPK
jgi:hypothetical protein